MMYCCRKKKKYNKGLFLTIGAAFRMGGCGNQSVGDHKSYPEQKLASVSQVNFINFLESKYNINIEMIINSYTTQFDDELINWYGHHVIKYFFHPKLIGWSNIYKTAIDLIENQEYDFIFIHRIDIVLKSHLKNVINIKSQKVTFPAKVHWWWLGKDGRHRPCDLMMFVPQKFFPLIFNNKLQCNHYALESMPQSFSKHLDYYISGFWDSDSLKQWNPLYRIVNRFEPKAPPYKSCFLKQI